MERRRTNTLTSRGRIFQGDKFLMEAPYSIEIWQKFPEGVPGLEEVVGSIKVDLFQTEPLIGKELTLELPDGKRMRFFFSNNSGSIAVMTMF